MIGTLCFLKELSCGLTWLGYLINILFRELSQRNLFYYKKMDSSNMGFDDDISLTDYIKENIKRPFFFHQHHFYTNFTK